MRLRLTKAVDYEGATFHFRPPDRAFTKMSAAGVKIMQERTAVAERWAAENPDAEPLPPSPVDPNIDLLEFFPDLWVEGLVGWDGIEGEDGEPLPFSVENAAVVPVLDKLKIIGGYLEAITEDETRRDPSEGKGTSSEPLPESTPKD